MLLTGSQRESVASVFCEWDQSDCELSSRLKIDSCGGKVMGGHPYMPRVSVRVSLCVTAKVLLNRCVLHSAEKKSNSEQCKPSTKHASIHAHQHVSPRL